MVKKTKRKSLSLTLRNYFIAGVVVLIPIGFTLYLSKVLIGISSKLIPKNLNPNHYLPFDIPGIEILISILLITIVGGFYLTPNTNELDLSLYGFNETEFSSFNILISSRLNYLSINPNQYNYDNIESQQIINRNFIYFSSSLGFNKIMNDFEINTWIMNTMRVRWTLLLCLYHRKGFTTIF